MINILLADDHAIIRAGLKIFISNYIPHCSIDEAGDGNVAFEKIKMQDYQHRKQHRYGYLTLFM